MRLPLSIYYGPTWWRLIARSVDGQPALLSKWFPVGGEASIGALQWVASLPPQRYTITQKLAMGGMN